MHSLEDYIYGYEHAHDAFNLIRTAYEGSSDFDVAIVGAGPKGLAMHISALNHGLRSVVLDTRTCEDSTWKNADELTLMHPPEVDITSSRMHSYQRFLRNDPEERRSSYGDLVDGRYSHAKHFHSYLEWLQDKLPNIVKNCSVDSVQGVAGRYVLNGLLRSKAIVLATGMRGFGRQEFMIDPTGLLGRSDRMTHSPGITTTSEDYQQFLKGRESLAIIGSGATAFAALEQLDAIKYAHPVHVITEQADAKDSILKELDRRRQSRHYFNRINIPQLHFYGNARVQSAMETESGLRIETERGSINVDACTLTTGFRFDIRRLPFMRNGDFGWNFELSKNKRYPKLNDQFEIQTSTGLPSQVYALGEIANDQSPEQAWLSSTAETTNKIALSIRRRVLDELEPKMVLAAK